MIKIYQELRVISKEQDKEDSDLPLAFVIPWENTKAKEKQLETAITWARSYNYDKETNKHTKVEGKDWGTVPNEPQSGFRLAHSVRRYGWSGSGNVVWRMVDPRGFEFEIPSENMAQILMSCGMGENGVIERPCIFGRDGARNVLLPEGTEFYQTAKPIQEAREEAKAAKLSVKDVPVGSIVSGPAITEAVYLGRVVLTSDRPELEGKKFYLFGKFFDYDHRKDTWWTFTLYSGFNVNKIHKKGTGEKPEGIEVEIHKALGVRANEMPRPHQRPEYIQNGSFMSNKAYYDYLDHSHFYNQYDSLDEKMGKIFGLWVNPDKPDWSSENLPNSLRTHNDYYTGCFVRKVTFL